MKMKVLPLLLVGLVVMTGACTTSSHDDKHDAVVSAQTREVYSILNLVKEHTIIAMKYYTDYSAQVEKLPVINPGPGEYVHVMEGQRYGYNNLTIGITETFPNGAPPMHSHEGEESHVLLEGEILYALADTMFTMKGPYIINIPAGVPHAFKNIGKKTANLVVIFPTNIWKYDVLDYFPFKSDTAKTVSRFSAFKKSLAKK